ncbi:MAG: NAD(P)/FAD-dependent oxidoreductase [Anaerolineae bacterium]|nr:NAD(P)/FAD-dependent oxidoreductase [Anaerolineae bacterium]
MPDYDFLVVGAGHNALVCAGYLVKAGYRVGVLERRSVVGGAVVTEEIVPGFRFDLGGSAHILIHHTPIVEDLELDRYGLDYIDLDPLFFAPYPDGSHLTLWKDVDRTCESIAQVSPQDAEAYRRFIDRWQPVASSMVEAFLHPPTPFNLGRYLIFGSGIGRDQRLYQLSDLLRGYGQVLRDSFESDQVRALIGWMAAQSGPPPTEPLSAPFALWHPMYHISGVKRPRGGSGMLTQALARMIEDYGGEILTDMPVQRILVRSGRAVGVETQSGRTLSARAVISGAHIHTTLGLLGEATPPAARTLLERSRIGNGFGMIVRYATHELPNYTVLPSPADGTPGLQHHALQLICPSLDYLNRAYGDYLGGIPSSDPALIAMTFSAVDPSLAPPGKHTLFLWGQYFPYELASGVSWDEVGEEVAAHMLAVLARYAPNVQDAVIDQLIETPLYLERTLGLLRGNVMHLDMSIDQMFMLRPALTMSNYRGPLERLYLTGASTHPGGGIMGAAGRNAASVILHDLSRARWR